MESVLAILHRFEQFTETSYLLKLKVSINALVDVNLAHLFEPFLFLGFYLVGCVLQNTVFPFLLLYELLA